MYRLVITLQARSRVGLGRIFIAIRELVEYFGLEEDISCDLEGPDDESPG